MQIYVPISQADATTEAAFGFGLPPPPRSEEGEGTPIPRGRASVGPDPGQNTAHPTWVRAAESDTLPVKTWGLHLL